MFEYDYTFCTHEACEDHDCFRHPSNIPVGEPVSVADLHNDPICPNYNVGLNTDTIIERIERISPQEGDILCLFYNSELMDADEVGEIHSQITEAINGERMVLMIPTSMDIIAINKSTAKELMKVFASYGN